MFKAWRGGSAGATNEYRKGDCKLSAASAGFLKRRAAGHVILRGSKLCRATDLVITVFTMIRR
jgi:hypothetical protein